jgi:hypothetical protein
VEIGFQTHAAHPDRVGDALLGVHGELLRENVNDLVAGWQHEFEHVVHEAVNVAVGDFGVIAFAGQDATMLQAFDVLSGNADVYGAELHAGIALADFHGFTDGANGFFDVGDHAAQYADAFDFADSDDFEFAVRVFRPARQQTFVVPMSRLRPHRGVVG